MQDTRGYNPYKFGMAGGSDSHNSASPYRQDNFFGLHADADGTVERRFAGVLIGGTMDVRLENPGGLTGVWAEENTRASIWDAMYRKETFGVSGPRIKVRLFGGWGYDKDIVNARDWIKQSYAGGVPMGADLGPLPTGGKGTAPKFVVWAVKDPTSGNLDRIQVVKGWTQNGQSFEKVFDVVWAGDRKPDKWSGRVPAIRSTVDLDKATYSNDVGAAELKTVWSDPEFDASLHAFYYLRVLEIPTPRWTLIQAVKAGLPPPDVVPLTGQERAWTTPIWYTPSAESRKAAAPGTTVTDLKAKGINALNDAQLKALLVGKAIWLRNNVTGEQFFQPFTAEGQTTVLRVGTGAVFPSAFGNVERGSYEGTTTAYRIDGGRLVIPVAQDPYSFTFYKVGDTYYRRAQQRVRLCQLRDRAGAADRRQPADGAVQPVLARAQADRRAEEADRADPAGRAQAARCVEDGHQAQRRAEGGGLAQARRVLRRADLAAAQRGSAAEVPGTACADAAAHPRGGGQPGRAEGESGRRSVVRQHEEVAVQAGPRAAGPPASRGRRSTRAWLAVALLCVGTAAAACPICLGAGQSTVAQQLAAAPQAVLALPTADAGQFRVVEVLRGERPSTRTIEGGYPRSASTVASALPKGEALLLIREDPLPGWVVLGAIGTDQAGWLRQLAVGQRVDDAERTAVARIVLRWSCRGSKVPSPWWRRSRTANSPPHRTRRCAHPSRASTHASCALGWPIRSSSHGAGCTCCCWELPATNMTPPRWSSTWMRTGERAMRPTWRRC